MGTSSVLTVGQAFPVIKQVRKILGDNLRFVFRHFPTVRTHPHSLRAATAAEAGVVIQDSGHWLMEEAPQQVIPQLVAFIKLE